MAFGVCCNCGESSELFGGECRACYQHRYRTGQARPESNIIAHARRFNERQAQRDMMRHYTT